MAASGKTGLPPPRPLHRGVHKRGCRSFLGVPRPPPLALTDNRRPLFPTSLPPPSLPDRLGRRHLLVYPVPGLRRGHQSRKQRAGRAGPDCPAPGGPERGSGAGLRGPWKPRGFLPVPFPRRPRCHPPRGAREPGRPQLRVRNQPLGPVALLLQPAPRWSIFSSLASFRSRCLAQHDVMPAAPRFPRELGPCSRPSPPPHELMQPRGTCSKLWGDRPQGLLLSPLQIGAAHGGHFIFPTLAPAPARV